MKTTNNKKHYFNAPEEDKGSRFCQCGKYLTDEVHIRKLQNMKYTTKASINAKGHTHEFTLFDMFFKRRKSRCQLCQRTAKELNIKFSYL